MRACLLSVVFFLLPACAGAQEAAGGASPRPGPDTFLAGPSIERTEAVPGDLLAAAGTVHIAARVAGDLIAAGGELRLAADAGEDLYAAGGELALSGSVAGNARLAGGDIDFARQGRIGGNATVAGGDIDLAGDIGGDLRAAGGRIRIDGAIGGDVEVAAGELVLGPGARISGRLRYRSGEPLRQQPGAQVQGGIERLQAPEWREPTRGAATALFGFWTVGLMLMAAALVALLPQFFARTSQAAGTHLGASILVGLLALFITPPVILALLFTVVGIPLAVFCLLFYFTLLFLAYVTAAIALGDATLLRFSAARAASRGARAAASAVAVLLIGFLTLIPWVGFIILLVALAAGMGALLLHWRAQGVAAAT